MQRRYGMTRMDLSLLLALFAACVLIGVNEFGYRQSNLALSEISQTQVTRSELNRLMQDMLQAETGQRGYLLTGDASYLAPYALATTEISTLIQQLRQRLVERPAELAVFDQLSQHLARKLGEMDITVRLRRQGNEDAWKFMLTTDVGREQMEALQGLQRQLAQASAQRLQESEQRIGQSLQLARTGIAIVAGLALLAFYLYLKQTRALGLAAVREQESLRKERDALEKQVRERTANLAELATHLQLAREDERGHLARELHDELGALLTAAKLDVARLRLKLLNDEPAARERLDHLVQQLNSGIELKRRIVEDLRPSSLTHLGLEASLEILTREFADSSGLQVTCDMEAVELDESRQLTVYRLVQESLTNVAKYAQATHLRIGLHSFEACVTVDVEDDGQGFDPRQARPLSYGIAGMRHRVEACGGRLTVTSAPGSGTRISAVIPRSA